MPGSAVRRTGHFFVTPRPVVQAAWRTMRSTAAGSAMAIGATVSRPKNLAAVSREKPVTDAASLTLR